MTYKEFFRWCNERVFDGCWGALEAIVCINICDRMRETPFWKREKKWQEYEHRVVTEIVNPTNEKIRKFLEEGTGEWND